MAKTAELRVLATVNVKPSKLILTEKFRGRSQLIDHDSQVELAESIRRTGQQQPLQVRGVEGTDTYEVVFGNSRKLAGDLISTGYRVSKDKEIAADSSFALRCEVVDVTDEDAFIGNVTENAQRNTCSPIDNAQNQEDLRTVYGMSDAAIARVYGWTGSALVNRLKKLLTLPEWIRNAIHVRGLTQSAAIVLADADDIRKADAYEELWKTLQSSAAEDAGVDGEAANRIGVADMIAAIKAYRKAITDAATAADPAAPAEDAPAAETPADPAGVYPLSYKQFKETLTEIRGNPRCPDRLAGCCENLESVIAGEKDSAQFVKWFMMTFGEVPKPAPVAAAADATPADAAPADAAPTDDTRDANNVPKNKKGKKGRKAAAAATAEAAAV